MQHLRHNKERGFLELWGCCRNVLVQFPSSQSTGFRTQFSCHSLMIAVNSSSASTAQRRALGKARGRQGHRELGHAASAGPWQRRGEGEKQAGPKISWQCTGLGLKLQGWMRWTQNPTRHWHEQQPEAKLKPEQKALLSKLNSGSRRSSSTGTAVVPPGSVSLYHVSTLSYITHRTQETFYKYIFI